MPGSAPIARRPIAYPPMMADKRSDPSSRSPKGPKPADTVRGAAREAKDAQAGPAPTKRTTPKGTGPAPTKRTTPKETGRYTPPIPKTQKVSPIWVPILMFTCLLGGMLMIITNYVSLLPDSPNNGWLLGGLGLITMGFITATRYH